MKRSFVVSWVLIGFAGLVLILFALFAPARASTGMVYFGQDVHGAVGDTVYVEIFTDVSVPRDTVRAARLQLDYDKSILNAVSVTQGADAPGVWLTTNNFVGYECAGLVFLIDNYFVDESWRGHMATVGFEVLRAEEAVVQFCRFAITGDNQLWLRHGGSLHCTTADSAHPWQYSDLTYPYYNCINRLVTSATVSVNPVSSSVLPISAVTWAALKELFR